MILQPHKIENLPDGGKNIIFKYNDVTIVSPVQPDDFDPLTASDEQLRTYAIPERPKEESALAAWNERFSTYTPVVSETLEVTDKYFSTGSSLSSSNWSGYIANQVSTSNRWVAVQGDFKQPSVSETLTSALMGSWVGIGGYNSGRLVQAGTAIEFTNSKKSYWAWYEFLAPGHQNPAIKFPVKVSPGDAIHIYVSYETANNRCSFYVENQTKSTYSNHYVLNEQPTNTYYDGTTAEWIDENARILFPNYGTNAWTNCKAYSRLQTWYPVGSVSNNPIQCNSPNLMSRPTSLTLSNGATKFTNKWYAH